MSGGSRIHRTCLSSYLLPSVTSRISTHARLAPAPMNLSTSI